jgi:ATP phosphoribosyltransferase regulatory subunit
MTPQVARIDAHRLQREVPTRLCYLGTVLHARPGRLDGTRSPLQVGAELYGHAGIASDVEVIRLMLETLALAGVAPVTLDLGHMGIFRGLSKQAGLGEERENELFDLLQRKAVADLASQLRAWKVPPRVRDMVSALTELDGDVSVLAAARRRLRAAPTPVHDALDALKAIVSKLAGEARGLSVHIDLAELRGYHYHTGVMFAAYQPGRGQALALGGRYDSLGAVFGRGRPATGFSADLRHLMQFAARDDRQPSRILAPASDNEQLHTAIARLRKRGETVVALLPGQRANAAAMGCDRCLALINGTWKVVKAD